MPVSKKTLAAVNDELRLNASEALAGTIVFHLENLAATITVLFECRMHPEAGQVGPPAWQPFQMANLATGALATSTSANGIFRGDASGQIEVRARVSASTGSIDVYGGVTIG